MTVVVSWRSTLFRFINGAQCSFIPFSKKPSSDQLPVTVTDRKVCSGFTRAVPRAGSRSHTGIVEAFTLRPNSGIQNSDDDVTFSVGLWE
ncbi:hypothetical protein HanXRQr2_Chr12g0552401 [Helianthus annuus]|uniref:Uncharacterized protein n=1 Tax=Helianthus annuus TaxID=4232 RepID=A0A9K3MWU8_HELAN|nr:hypothetical protein HanXRQr2_Chr12g0552401 [Helianthus annuus]KAJ0863586.1 hypothetical protein HanPSC8_Chr12g0531791 [Helianthus annuus]